MTNVPNDQIDVYETVVARRVGAFSDQAIEPIDAAAIARSAALGDRRVAPGARRRFGVASPSRRYALIGVGAVLVTALGVFVGVGGLANLRPVQSAGATTAAVAPGATPTTVPGAELVHPCGVASLRAGVTAWGGAAGHRIATVVVENVGATACSIWTLAAPQLVDATGRVLIDGHLRATPGSLMVEPNAVVSTMVDTANYCGPDPALPLTVAFGFIDGRHLGVSPDLDPRALSDAPPCNGPTMPGEIQMQPFVPGMPAG
jgi:hypothetical protein